MNIGSIAKATLGKGPTEFAAAVGVRDVTVPPARDPGEPRYLELPYMGISAAIDENDATTCLQFYGLGVQKPYKRYGGELLNGVTLFSSREQVRGVLGRPQASDSGGPGKRLFGKFMYPWDAFFWADWKLHIEYTEDASGIRLVSVMPRE